MTDLPLHLYHCSVCDGYTLTIQRDHGQVKGVIACRASGFGECAGDAIKVPDDQRPSDAPTEPRWEWRNMRRSTTVSRHENRAVAAIIYLAPLELWPREVGAAL